MSTRPTVVIHTDGACSGNPGPGGYGVVLSTGTKTKELSQGYRNTTNNRMELRAVLAALQALTEPCTVTLYTDSQYIVNAVNNRWVYTWESKAWRKADKKPALNSDLWKQLLELLKVHSVEFVWVRGHSNNRVNEICDRLAVAASQSFDLLEDIGYKSEQDPDTLEFA